MASRRWVFTLNNYTPENEQQLIAFGNSGQSRYLVFGREIAPTTGTRHLQGFVILPGPQRLSWVRENIVAAHWEPARGTSSQASIYCKKDNDYQEFGEVPTQSGRRTDIEAIISWIDEFGTDNGRPPTEREIAQYQPRAFLIYRNISHLARLRCPVPTIREGEPQDWQRQLAEELEADADDRSVVFHLDIDGGKGKTWFQQWFFSSNKDKVQLLGVGKRDDMAYAVDPDKSIFFINVPRGGMEFLQYTILEQLKDRMVFSTKYETQMKVLTKTPHVHVFCNEMPNMDKMSADRYIIHQLL